MAATNRAKIESAFSNAVSFFQREVSGERGVNQGGSDYGAGDARKHSRAIEERLALAQSDKSASISPGDARVAESAMKSWSGKIGSQFGQVYEDLKEQRDQAKSRVTELEKNKATLKKDLRELKSARLEYGGAGNEAKYKKAMADYKKARKANRANNKNLKSARKDLRRIRKQLSGARRNYRDAKKVSACAKDLRNYRKRQINNREGSIDKSAAVLAGADTNKTENMVAGSKQQEKNAADSSLVNKASLNTAADSQGTGRAALDRTVQNSAAKSGSARNAGPKPVDDHSHDLAKKDEMSDFRKGPGEGVAGQDDFSKSVLALSAEVKHAIVAIGKELASNQMKLLEDGKSGPSPKQHDISPPAVASGTKNQEASPRGRA